MHDGICRAGQRRWRGLTRIFGGYGAVPTFGGDPICDADVGAALRAFAHPTE
ncbi:MAG TPA: hypothetical protein VGI22_10315 [Xanthobacteraceae bacterium]|jgi:hypothetical protein